MKPKRFWLVRPLNIMLIAISLVMCGVLFFANRLLFFIFTPIVLLLDILAAVRIWRIQQDLHKVITSMGKAVSDRNEAGLIHFLLCWSRCKAKSSGITKCSGQQF